MNETFWTHLSMVAAVVVPLGSGITYLIRGQIRSAAAQARIELKVDTMWEWFTQHGHEITGYQKGDEFRRRG